MNLRARRVNWKSFSETFVSPLVATNRFSKVSKGLLGETFSILQGNGSDIEAIAIALGTIWLKARKLDRIAEEQQANKIKFTRLREIARKAGRDSCERVWRDFLGDEPEVGRAWILHLPELGDIAPGLY